MTPTFLNPPRNYTPETFAAFVATLRWIAWSPKFICLHNTALPTLAQLLNKTLAQREARIVGENAMYLNTDHWHAGPHLFTDPYADGIWNACDLTKSGVAASCFNGEALFLEMGGNYATPNELRPGIDPPADDWNSAEAQIVRDNAVAAMAILHRVLGLRPDGFVKGVSGLHFHRDCPQDHHLCPGGQVSKDDMIARVLAKMQELRS